MKEFVTASESRTVTAHGIFNRNIIYDNSTKDTEIIKFTKDVDEHMGEEVLPHVPDAAWFFEKKADAKKPIIKTGSGFQFTRYFYEYRAPEKAEDLLNEFIDIEQNINEKISALLQEV